MVKKAFKKNVDAMTKATPSSSQVKCIWDFTDSNGKQVSLDKKYMFFVEGTIVWKDNVLYNGIIDAKSSGNIKINTTYSTDKAKKSNMINNVTVTY